MAEELPHSPTPPQEDQPPNLVLQYRSPAPAVQRKPRKPLPAALCLGFFGGCVAMGAAWLSVAEVWRRTPWIIVPVLSGMAAAGGAGLLFRRTRVACIGVLLALGVWLLMWGPCASLGGV